MKRVNLHSTLLMFHLFQNKIFSKKYFHILQYLFYVKIFLANQNNYRQICVKCFTLEILVKHFTFCALTHPPILCLTFTLLSIFSKTQPTTVLSSHHLLHLRHHPSLGPLSLLHLRFFFFFFLVILHCYCRLHHFLATSTIISSSIGS